MKLHLKEVRKAHGTSYLAFSITEKENEWINKGKVGFLNSLLLGLFNQAYPSANILHSAPPFIGDKDPNGEHLLLINVLEWCSHGHENLTDALLRATLSSMTKDNLMSIEESNNLLEQVCSILSVPFIKLLTVPEHAATSDGVLVTREHKTHSPSHTPNPYSFHAPKTDLKEDEQQIQEKMKLITDCFDAKLLNKPTLPELSWQINRTTDKGVCLVLQNFNIPESGKDRWLARFQKKFPDFDLSIQFVGSGNKLVFNNILHKPAATLSL